MGEMFDVGMKIATGVMSLDDELFPGLGRFKLLSGQINELAKFVFS
jgi:hypothetical protein